MPIRINRSVTVEPRPSSFSQGRPPDQGHGQGSFFYPVGDGQGLGLGCFGVVAVCKEMRPALPSPPGPGHGGGMALEWSGAWALCSGPGPGAVHHAPFPDTLGPSHGLSTLGGLPRNAGTSPSHPIVWPCHTCRTAPGLDLELWTCCGLEPLTCCHNLRGQEPLSCHTFPSAAILGSGLTSTGVALAQTAQP